MKKKIQVGLEFEFVSKNISKLVKELVDNYSNIIVDLDNNLKGNGINWYLTKDGANYEIITPILTYKEALLAQKNILDMLKKHQVQTTDNCGLHINISSDGYGKLNGIKFLLLAKHYNLINWKTNRNQTVRDIYPILYETDLKLFEENIHNIGKYYNISLRDPKINFLEFRVMGGENYHHKVSKILVQYEQLLNCYIESCSNIKDDLYISIYKKIRDESENKNILTLDDLEKLAKKNNVDVEEKLKLKSYTRIINFEDNVNQGANCAYISYLKSLIKENGSSTEYATNCLKKAIGENDSQKLLELEKSLLKSQAGTASLEEKFVERFANENSTEIDPK